MIMCDGQMYNLYIYVRFFSCFFYYSYDWNCVFPVQRFSYSL